MDRSIKEDIDGNSLILYEKVRLKSRNTYLTELDAHERSPSDPESLKHRFEILNFRVFLMQQLLVILLVSASHYESP